MNQHWHTEPQEVKTELTADQKEPTKLIILGIRVKRKCRIDVTADHSFDKSFRLNLTFVERLSNKCNTGFRRNIEHYYSTE